MPERSLFLKQLRHWGLHTTICATPSFIIAILSGFNTPVAIAAMLCGITTVMLGYSYITSHPLYSGNPTGILSKAALYGARTRSVISLLELLVLAIPSAGMFFLPDLFAGYLALVVVGMGNFDSIVSNPTFLPTYLATILEGLIISLSLYLVFLLGMALIHFFKSKPISNSNSLEHTTHQEATK